MNNKQIEDLVDLMFNCNIEEEIKKETKTLEIVKERNELRKKIDKAIKYIKENASYGIQEKCCMDDLNYDNCDELLEILGENK